MFWLSMASLLLPATQEPGHLPSQFYSLKGKCTPEDCPSHPPSGTGVLSLELLADGWGGTHSSRGHTGGICHPGGSVLWQMVESPAAASSPDGPWGTDLLGFHTCLLSLVPDFLPACELPGCSYGFLHQSEAWTGGSTLTLTCCRGPPRLHFFLVSQHLLPGWSPVLRLDLSRTPCRVPRETLLSPALL